MSAEALATRVFKHLERQAQWLAEKQGELAALAQDPTAEDLEVRHRAISRNLDTLLEEQRLLLREWNALENVEPQLREAVQARAREVLELLLATSAAMQVLQDRLDREAAERAAELAGLRTGRNVVQGYISGGEQPGFERKG